MIGLVGLLMETGQDPKQRHFAELANVSGESLRRARCRRTGSRAARP